MSEFKKFKDIIDRYYDSINLGSPSNAPSEERIAETEKNLEVKLPPSYIWFLTHFLGGRYFRG
ncbi:SMI1/KNR4 family protein [Terasakiella sp.]|uniref:SMI1/KNR4 family protein n=1 Tax=Terasakiella sp. TaxID=2034861 RepID=UPI003AA97FF9